MEHPQFMNNVSQVWNQPVNGYAMFRIFYKLKIHKKNLRKLNRNSFVDISKQVRMTKEDLLQL